MVKDYRKKVGSETGGIKLYHNLKTELTNQNINIVFISTYLLLKI
jgi:putative transposase